nr:phosphatase PAP2 family protein [uncultured Vibrio sp.]
MEQDSSCELRRSWIDKSISCFISIKKELLVDKVFYLYCFITTLIIYSFSLYLDFPINYSFITYLDTLGTGIYITGVFWCIYYYFYLLLKKETRPIRKFWIKIKQILIPFSKPISFIISITFLNLVFSNHTFLKSLIPTINPFHWDKKLSDLDEIIHFGFTPWEITHMMFSSPWSSLMINVAYNAWFFVMWGVLIFFLIYKKRLLLRQQFLLTFALSWMFFGVFLATIFSSAGPCFMDLVAGDNRYVPLMDKLNLQSQYLTNIDFGRLWALSTQEYLWNEYITNTNSIGAGISAMPSMHVSIAVLMALSIHKLSKKIGYIFYFFAVVIQIGSVHLGWHYAIDGYVSIIFTILLWKIVGNILINKPRTSYF